ncbi:MAG: hypothetical protein J5645_05600 [Lachnospiraceae bacterium]|nr:hypothetical protein [Lachnospiraceae bacterium]
MIESIEYAIQILLGAVGVAMSAVFAMRTRHREFVLLMLGIGVYSLGDLYMLLYLIFYGVTPGYSYVHDISWYSASLFFAFLAFEMLGERAKGQRRKIIWLVPAFTVGMCIFFL